MDFTFLCLICYNNDIAKNRNQSLAQMALSWLLSNPAVTTVLVGASRPQQIVDNVGAVYAPDFTEDELKKIREIITSVNV